MVPRQGRPLQNWKIFLRNHVEEIASIDLFVVPRIAWDGVLKPRHFSGREISGEDGP